MHTQSECISVFWGEAKKKNETKRITKNKFKVIWVFERDAASVCFVQVRVVCVFPFCGKITFFCSISDLNFSEQTTTDWISIKREKCSREKIEEEKREKKIENNFWFCFVWQKGTDGRFFPAQKKEEKKRNKKTKQFNDRWSESEKENCSDCKWTLPCGTMCCFNWTRVT